MINIYIIRFLIFWWWWWEVFIHAQHTLNAKEKIKLYIYLYMALNFGDICGVRMY